MFNAEHAADLLEKVSLSSLIINHIIRRQIYTCVKHQIIIILYARPKKKYIDVFLKANGLFKRLKYKYWTLVIKRMTGAVF